MRLFASPLDSNPPVVTGPPPSPSIESSHAPTGLAKPRRQRAVGRNGSHRQSRDLKNITDRRQRNSIRKKQAINAQSGRAGPAPNQPLTPSPRPVPFGVLQQQVRESVGSAPTNPEDRIFLEQLARLGAQPNNLDRFEMMEEKIGCLEEERERAERVIHETPEDRALAQKKRAQLMRQTRAERRRKAAQRQERLRRVAAQLDRRVAEDRKRLNMEQEARNEGARRMEEAEQKRVEEVRKCRERAERELMLQSLRAGQPLTPKQLENKKLVMEVMAEFQEEERRKAEARRAARLEEEQRQLRERERARLERERQLREEAEAARARAAQRQAEEGEHERLMRSVLEAAQRRAEELKRARVAWEQENARRAAEEAENAKRRAEKEEARRQAEFAQRQRLAEEEARQRAHEEARRHAAQERAQRAAQWAQAQAHWAQEQRNPFQDYETKWQALKGQGGHSDIPFCAFPWPVLGAVYHPSQLHSWDVDMFLTLRGTAGKTLKAIVKAEILRWHPDKLAAPLKKVHPDHREAVKEGGEIIAKILNGFMENVTQEG
ncbi:hypothetical protein LshimejAT787_0603620 [Lyophyllum shimeji]|uniref:Uncharacterized protein n=1 Tax=Lyophyllum shimeji TaxID=47721 RepID=A0A9P3PNM7_LYOSH|nr:hypothetical protein LshimejAT787_0603620 [Lyophyllum shimeji]